MRKYYSKKYNTKNNKIFDVSKNLKNFNFYKNSENIKIPQKILSEINKKWFLAFDILENNFLKED